MRNNINRILFVTEYLPYPPDTGAKTPFYYLIKELALYQDCLELGVVSLFDKKDINFVEPTSNWLRLLGVKWFKFIEKKDETLFYKMTRYDLIPKLYSVNIFEDIIAEFRPNVIFLGLNELSVYITSFFKEESCLSVPIIFFPRDNSLLNIESRLRNDSSFVNRMINSIKLYLRKRAIRKFRYSRFEKYIYLSERDAERFRNFIQKPEISSKVVVIPLGVDTEKFSPVEQRDMHLDRVILLFTGVLDYPPNEEASLTLLTEIFPKISYRYRNTYLYLVGRNPTERVLKISKELERVFVTGYVDNIVSYYQDSDIYICPVKFGSGMKNKILEAMSSGLPVISFYEGVAGIDKIEESGLIVVDNTNEMLEALERLILNPTIRKQLGRKNRNFIENRYSWKAICRKYIKEITLSEGLS